MTKASCATFCARAVERLERDVFHKNAGNFPGVVAKKLDKNVLESLASKITDTSIVVSATNGKTTTTNLIAQCLEADGHEVFCNRDGSNLETGIITTLLPKRNASHAVFECDELYTRFVLPRVKPTYFMLLNLFPDQVDRFGSIDRIQDTFVEALAQTPETSFVYNADDPYCSAVADAVCHNTISFGIDFEDSSEKDQQIQNCSVCKNSPLHYEKRYYGQLGVYHCPSCGAHRVQPDFEACHVEEIDGGYRFDVVHEGAVIATLTSPSTGLYMVYNILAAFVMSWLCQVQDVALLQHCIDTFNPRNGRLQTYHINQREVLSNLAKNPVGFNQNIDMILRTTEPCAVAFLVNNNESDGRDIAWIHDVRFEALHDMHEQGMPVFAGGMINEELKKRLSDAGIVAQDAQKAHDVLQALSSDPTRKVIFVANYTALPPVHKELELLEKEG